MAAVTTAAGFVPRTTFAVSPSITAHSYFLGHHSGALSSMRRVLSGISLVIECRDARVPLSSRNPLLEAVLMGSRGGVAGGLGGGSFSSSVLGGRRSGGSVGSAVLGDGGGGPARDRIVVYTKADLVPPSALAALCEPGASGTAGSNPEAGDSVFLVNSRASSGAESKSGVLQLVNAIRRRAELHRERSVLPLTALVVGMPNAGKSSLLNALRRTGVAASGADAGGGRRGKVAKAAKTGAEPGVTRKIGTPVRILSAADAAVATATEGSSTAGGDGGGPGAEAVYVLDTPGVFVPHVSDPETMLRLALAGLVKDGLVPLETLADYLLFHLNLVDPKLYTEPTVRGGSLSAALCTEPTNDVHVFLDSIARRTGKLGRGGVPNHEAAAAWVVQRWRNGLLGRFVLEDVGREAVERFAREGKLAVEGSDRVSINQARRREKEARKERSRARYEGRLAASQGS